MTQTAEQPDQNPGGDPFARYMDVMGDVPLLGYLVLYSVFDGQVTPERLAGWFRELGLDTTLLPSPIRADGAFEIVTHNTRISYGLPSDDIPGGPPAAVPSAAGSGKERRKRTDQDRTATLMVRQVRRDAQMIVCHVVREVRDSAATRLSYTERVAEVIFRRDKHPGAGPGAGRLQLIPVPAAMPMSEQAHLAEMLGTLNSEFNRYCRYLTGDKIRTMLRVYVESLYAIRVRATGGVYFVHHRHQATLDGLRALMKRFGAGSNLYCVPLPDQEEMRVMVIEAWRAKARQDMQKLAAEIASAQAAARDGDPMSTKAIEALYRKFQALRAEAGEHSELLSADLDDTDAAMQLVHTQLAGLLAQAG